MQHTWTHGNYAIAEGLKPGSKTFRYFFKIFEEGKKKCHYCVWIVDDALTRFDPAKDFNAIIASRQEDWHAWVKAKIDGGDFRNRALKLEKAGQQEIDLSEMTEHVTVE